MKKVFAYLYLICLVLVPNLSFVNDAQASADPDGPSPSTTQGTR